MIKIFHVGILSLLLTACGAPYIHDETPPLHTSLKAGDILQVNKEITILPTRTRVKFQFTEITSSGTVSFGSEKFAAVCSIQLHQPQNSRFVIQPQELKISRVEPYTEPESLIEQIIGVYIYLEPGSMPKVRRIDCHKREDTTDLEYFTLRMFEQSFGDYIRIKR